MRNVTHQYRHGLLLLLLLVLALFVAACGQDTPETVTAPVGTDATPVAEVTAVATAVADEVDAVSTTVMNI